MAGQYSPAFSWKIAGDLLLVNAFWILHYALCGIHSRRRAS